jgi:YHYH protein
VAAVKKSFFHVRAKALKLEDKRMQTHEFKVLRVSFVALCCCAMIGCNSPDKKANTSDNANTSASATGRASSGPKVDPTLFSKDALVKTPIVVDCTLADGSPSKCVQMTVKYKPDNLQIGPFCPATLGETGGIWNWDGENANLYRINGDFLRMLNKLGYSFYDANGNVYITTDLSSRPKFNNTCMAMTPQKAVEMTILLPASPKMADKQTNLGTVAKVGLALDGVPIFADAPSVLQTGHMPALDTCGGHIDPGGWYHWHATSTDINSLYEQKKVDAKCALQQSPSAQFAYAFDGYAMYGSVDIDGKVPTDLDACNGHVGPTKTNPQGEYHYHATANFPNLPACLKGVQAKDNFSTTSGSGIGSARGGGPGGGHGGPPNFSDAARRLGVTENALRQAIEDAGGRDADLAKVAKSLNVSEAALMAALPRPPN